ncbi:MAG: trimethylamine methyltransferase family protein [Spirochaetes bacterium]|nr:trimethylamine methyltransferase family protein [Spirochaetota bacterium]
MNGRRMIMPLKRRNVKEIHSVSVKILDNVGIMVESEEAVRILHNAGARIIPETKRVCIPPALVEDALRKAPSSFSICGREEGLTLEFKRGSKPLFGGSGVPSIIHDLETGKRRDATLEDYIYIVRLLDGLSNVDLVTDSCTFCDVAGKNRDITALFHLANNTKKPLLLHITFSREEDFGRIIDMTDLLKKNIFSGRPFVIFRISPMISPLRLDEVHTNHLITAARADIPVCPVSAPQAGMNAPVTLAGALSLMNAEVLALLVVTQCAHPSTPFIYGPYPEVTNFLTGGTRIASAEALLLNIAANQLAEYYGLPNWVTVCRTDSKTLDIQAGYENSLGALPAALSGATYVSAISGLLESALSLSFEKLVIDDEIIGMVKRISKGIQTTKDHYAYGLIESIGPGGTFLAERHTVDHMREEYFFPKLSGISDLNKRAEQETPCALKNANIRAKQIIASHSIPPLPDSIVKKITRLMPDSTIADTPPESKRA